MSTKKTDAAQKSDAPPFEYTPTTPDTDGLTATASAPPPAFTTAPPPDMVSLPKAQLDELLDGMLDLQEQVAALKSAQVGKAAAVVDQADETAKFDAELKRLTEEFKDAPNIQAFERRALVGLDANLDIRLKGDLSVMEDPAGDHCYWKLRWFNFGKEGRAQQFDAEGYMKVEIEELVQQEMVSGLVRSDRYVRRGNRGEEVLGKIQRKLYDYKKRRDAASRAGLLSSESQLQDHQANSVAAMVGARGGNADQAGSFVKGMSVTITPTKTERFTP